MEKKTEGREGGEEGEQGLTTAVYARTALILPFSFGETLTPPHLWANALLGRRIPHARGKQRTGRLWGECDSHPLEVGELAPGFRTAIGWQDPWLIHTMKEESKSGQQELQPQFLRVTNAAKDLLFRHARVLCTDPALIPHRNAQQEEETREGILRQVDILDIKAVIYPLGIGLLVIEVDWLPNEGDSAKEISMDQLSSWIYLSRLCHGSEKQTGGWSFCAVRDDEEEEGKESHLSEQEARLLGTLGVTLREGQQLPLTMLGDWLLHLPEENPSSPPARTNRRRCHHHTAIFANRTLSSVEAKDTLFRLRRGIPFCLASHQHHRPSPKDVEEGWDEVLSYQDNLSIGLSREGTCFLMWPTTETDILPVAGFPSSMSQWPALAHGVYLLLAQQVHAERWALAVLDALALQRGSIVMSHSSGSLEELERHRIQLKDLASMMLLYTLSLSHDDCGGSFEQAFFFYKLRQVLGVPSAKEEIRKSIADILSFVESEYQEEEKKLRRREIAEQRHNRQSKKEQERMKERRHKGWEVAMIAISVAVLPVLMVAGFFGMNVPDIPEYTFWQIVLFTTGISLLLMGVLASILLVVFRQRRAREDDTSSWLHRGIEIARRSFERGRHSEEDEGGRVPAQPSPLGVPRNSLSIELNGTEQSALLRRQHI